MSSRSFLSCYPAYLITFSTIVSALAVPTMLWLFIYLGASFDLLGVLTIAAAIASSGSVYLARRAQRNRARRPVVDISDDGIEYGSIFAAASSLKRVSIGEITGIVQSSKWRMVLGTRSGRRVGIPLTEVSRAERDAVREEIERRVAPHSEQSP